MTIAIYHGVKRYAFNKYNKLKKCIEPNIIRVQAEPNEYGVYLHNRGSFKDVHISQVEEYYREQFVASYSGINFDMITVALETKKVRLLRFAERRKFSKVMSELGITGTHYDRDLDAYETIVPLNSIEQICRNRKDFLTGSTRDEIISGDEFWTIVLRQSLKL